MNNVFDIVDSMEAGTARKTGLRALAHGCLNSAIYLIRSTIFQREYQERQNAVKLQFLSATEMDVRNENDELAREGGTNLKAVTGREGRPSVEEIINAADAVKAGYDSCYHELRKDALASQFDIPMSMEEMLAFRCSNAQPLNEGALKMAAQEYGCTVDELRQMMLEDDRDERAKFKAHAPEIAACWNSLVGSATVHIDGVQGGFDQMDWITQHQLGVKVATKMAEAKRKVLKRILRGKPELESGSITLLQQGIDELISWGKTVEKAHGDLFREAIDSGRDLMTFD